MPGNSNTYNTYASPSASMSAASYSMPTAAPAYGNSNSYGGYKH